MGAFLVNFHVKTADVDQLRSACLRLKLKDFQIAPQQGAWTTLYEEQASSQDDSIINRLAGGLSASLNAPCIAFLVHDSDIACYWLYDKGQLLDEFNSCPDYFGEAVSKREREKVRGRPEVFLRYCQPGVTLEQVTDALQGDPTFADDTVAQLAKLLGIDEELALSTYGDEEMEGEDDEYDDDDEDDDVDEPGGISTLKFPRPDVAAVSQLMQKQFEQMMGSDADVQTTAASDALVQAAAEGEWEKVDQLLKQGVPLNAPGKLPMQNMSSLNSGLAANPRLSLAVPPLLAAAARGHAEVVKKLIEHGAQLEYVHPALGSALHLAAQAGTADAVAALLEAGCSADLQNAQGQTALAVLRTIQLQINAAKAMLQSMPGLKASAEKLLGQKLPEAGWNACEKLLKEAGGS